MTIEAPPLWLQAGHYPARLDRQIIAAEWDEGVMTPAACKVRQRAAGANMTVEIDVGAFVIKGDDQALQGTYMGRITALETVALTNPPGADSRYDLVTLRVNDPNALGNVGDTVTVEVVAGAVAAAPVVPALPPSSIAIAIIGPITNATPSVTTAMIHDAHTGTGPTGVAFVRLLAGKRIGVGIIQDFIGAGHWVPNGYLLCAGQEINRAAYPDLFELIGTSYGAGTGGVTFNLPDLRGRVAVALDNMGGTDAGRIAAPNALGGVGGAETRALAAADLPAHQHTMNHGHADGTSDGANTDHAHYVSIQSGGQSVDHWHGTQDQTYPLFVVQSFAPGGSGLVSQNNGIVGPENRDRTGGVNTDHSHGVNGWSGGQNVSHAHTTHTPAFNGNTGSVGGGAGINTMPPYILVNKIIRT